MAATASSSKRLLAFHGGRPLRRHGFCRSEGGFCRACNSLGLEAITITRARRAEDQMSSAFGRPGAKLIDGDGGWNGVGAPASQAARRRRIPYGPNLGAGVWLKSGSSVTHIKFAAMLVLPLPRYLATLG